MDLTKTLDRIFVRIISAMSRDKKDNILSPLERELQKEIGKIFIN